MSLRKTTSLTVLFSFVLLIVTSVVLFVMPHGRVAYWSSWECLGLEKEAWGALHTNLGLLFVVSGIIHTAINWTPMISYLKNKSKKMHVFTPDFNIALVITLFVTVCTVLELPPVYSIQVACEALKEKGSEKYGEPPYGHAELSSLKIFCQRMDLELKPALEKLAAAGIACESSQKTILEIAEVGNLTSQQVFELIKPTPNGKMTTIPPGFGRYTLAEVCEMYALDQPQIISGMKFLGLKVSADQKIKAAAQANGKEPYDLFEIIKSLAEAPE